MEREVFLEKFMNMNSAISEFIEFCCAGRPVPNGKVDKLNEQEEIQSLHDYSRPSEFLRVLLDMTNASFDPRPSCSMLLNCNLNFFYDAVPKRAFSLGYLSVLSEPGVPFSAFWTDIVTQRISAKGYDLKDVKTMFVVVSVDSERFSMRAHEEIIDVTKGGFSVNETLALFGCLLADKQIPHKDVYTGIVCDDMLSDRFRVSILLYIDPDRRKLLESAKLFKRTMAAFELSEKSTRPATA